MLQVPPPLLEPGPRLLARLLRVPLAETGTLFGDDLGEEGAEQETDEPEWLRRAGSVIAEGAVTLEMRASPALSPSEPEWLRRAGSVLAEGAVTLETRASPALSPSEMKAFLVRTLGKKRGVLSAFPALPGLSSRPRERLLALNGKVAAGHAFWWLWNLQRAVFSRRDSYTTLARWPGAGDVDLSVYRLVGEPSRAFDWMPGGAIYGIHKGVIDAYLHYGLAVSVRDLQPTGKAPPLEAQTQQVALTAHLTLDAAAHGIGPAVFACMLIYDGDEYVAMQKTLLPANAAITPETVAELARENSTHVRALVMVTQMHTFRLSDMLRAFVDMDASENHARARAQVLLAVGALADKLEQLADLKTLKLNMTPDTVIFCPDLGEEEDCEDWVLKGFGFRARGFECIKGKPFLWDFDPRLCKRLAQQSGYDRNAALVLMALVLLEATRAQCGEAAHEIVREGMLAAGSPVGQAWRAAREKAETFSYLLAQAFQHTRVERDALPSDVLVDTGRDLTATLMADALAPLTPRFRSLVELLLGARRYDPAELPTNAEQAERRAAQQVQRERLAGVARKRHVRLLARHGEQSKR